MIASLTRHTISLERLSGDYVRFLEALKASGFEGDIAPDYASRTVAATDNSIYQRLPQAVLYPRHAEDLERIAKLAGEVPNATSCWPRAAAAPAPTASR